MRIVTVLALLAILLLPVASHAQEGGGVKVSPAETSPFYLSTEDLPNQTKGGQLESSAIRKYADQFYKACMDEPDPAMEPEYQLEHCTCLSAQTYNKRLTTEELEWLATGKGKPMENARLLNLIYAPCVGIPMRERIYKDCYTNSLTRIVAGEQSVLEGICACLVSEMGSYVDDAGPATVARHVYLKPDLIDHLAAIASDYSYRTELARANNRCMQKNRKRSQ